MENSVQQTLQSTWEKSKWIVKGCIIGVISLILIIPTIYVKNLVYERQGRQEEATAEITSKWAGKQNIVGPIIGIPYRVPAILPGKGSTQIAYFLPDTFVIDANLDSKEKHRGIFKVMLYQARTTLKGTFSSRTIQKLNIPAEQFLWNEAFVTLNVADQKGLNEQPVIRWNGRSIELSPGPDGEPGLRALLGTQSIDDFTNVTFETTLDINGSGQLLFTPIGKTTTVNVNSNWKDPSFSGMMLPQTTNIGDTGFKATWKVMAQKRSFPQQWTDENSSGFSNRLFNPRANNLVAGNPVDDSVFGVDLYIPVNGYQKTLRTVKYALLCILLTFAAFFIIETNNKKSAHPFQYGLIGLALILFYTLLLSISEYTGFNIAYIIASVATISLIGWFVKMILQTQRAAVILSVVLVLVYAYVFSLLQLQDYSLLLGSIGLFLTLAIVMHFSRKLKW